MLPLARGALFWLAFEVVRSVGPDFLAGPHDSKLELSTDDVPADIARYRQAHRLALLHLRQLDVRLRIAVTNEAKARIGGKVFAGVDDDRRISGEAGTRALAGTGSEAAET